MKSIGRRLIWYSGGNSTCSPTYDEVPYFTIFAGLVEAVVVKTREEERRLEFGVADHKSESSIYSSSTATG